MKKYSLKTKRSSRRSSSERDFKKLFIWLFIVILLLFGVRNLTGYFSSFITTPFFSIRHYIDTSQQTVPVFIREREDLLNQIRDLEQEISSMQGVDNVLSMFEDENDSLRTLLGASSSPRIAAGVIARPPDTPYDVVLIDRGKNDGVVTNAPVYYGERKALGYVGRVFSNHSIVTLFSSPGVETSVYLFGPDVFVTAYGQGGGVIKISTPQGILIEEGNLVIAPSVEGGILGNIENIDSSPSEPEQHAFLTYDIPIQSIRLVGVGREPLSTISFEDAKEAVVDYENKFLRFEIPEEVNAETDPEGTSTPNELEIP